MPASDLLRRHYWILYVAWIALCSIAYVGMGSADDPTAPNGRLSADDAGVMALTALRARSPRQFENYEVNHVAFSSHGELGPEARWVVLCEEPLESSSRGRVVVELSSETGAVLRIRKPVLEGDSPSAGRILQSSP
ncbi:MAG: hypothetical protein ABI718_10485 [Acidobacteriota bacterium]